MIETQLDPQHVILALAGGILPAILWLWFWLREDKTKPEPRKMIALVFLLGMVAVPVAGGIQYSVMHLENFLTQENILSVAVVGIAAALFAAFIEELLKLFAAGPALKSIHMDEPIDGIIYLIVASLGFAGLENSLYILGTILETELISEAALVGNLRSIGASLLHVVSGAALGSFIAFSFYESPSLKKISLAAGIACATLIHFIYNTLISRENLAVLAFLAVWVLVIVLLIVFEKVKFWDKMKRS